MSYTDPILSIALVYFGRLPEHLARHHEPASPTRQRCWRPRRAGNRRRRVGHHCQTRPDKDAMDAAIADFLKQLSASRLRNRSTGTLQGYMEDDGALSRLERWTRRDFLSMQRWRQVCCSAWMTRRSGTSHPQRNWGSLTKTTRTSGVYPSSTTC